MSTGKSIVLEIGFGAAWATPCAANTALPRIGPATARPTVLRTPVRWTLVQGEAPQRRLFAPRLA